MKLIPEASPCTKRFGRSLRVAHVDRSRLVAEDPPGRFRGDRVAAVAVTPAARRLVRGVRLGASRMPSVFGLKASAQIAKWHPFGVASARLARSLMKLTRAASIASSACLIRSARTVRRLAAVLPAGRDGGRTRRPPARARARYRHARMRWHSADWSPFVPCTAAVTARLISQGLAVGRPCGRPPLAHDRRSRLLNAKPHSERADVRLPRIIPAPGPDACELLHGCRSPALQYQGSAHCGSNGWPETNGLLLRDVASARLSTRCRSQ